MSLITRSITKARAIQYSKELRNGKFTRVSKALLDHLERMVDAELRRIVSTHRTAGKTLEAPSVTSDDPGRENAAPIVHDVTRQENDPPTVYTTMG